MRFYLVVFAATTLALVGACGGGSAPQEEEMMEEMVGDPDLSILTIGFPAFVTGDDIDIVFDLQGGCGGPYTMNLISGALPDGLMLDSTVTDNGVDPPDHRHHMTGILCKAGVFDFIVRITDIGCSMPKVATRQYQWTIAEGALRLRKSDPQMIRVDNYQDVTKWPLIDVLPPQKINTNAAIQLIPTGGQGPYTIVVTDDMADPNDDAGLPPLTALGGPNGDVIQGSPQQLGPGGMPWRVSFLVTDSMGATCICKLQWPITP